eukprot:68071_1
MELDLHLSFSLSPPVPTPTPSPEPMECESQEPPNKRRKLNTLKTENTNTYTNNHNNAIKVEPLTQPIRKKRKLPSLVCNQSLSTKRSRKRYNNNNSHDSNGNKNIKMECNIKPKIHNNNKCLDNDCFNWNNIAITSLTSIFEYINVKFLYFNASKVCKYWYLSICCSHSDFIFGYFRKTMHLNPLEPLTFIQLKSYNVPYIKQELKLRNLSLKGKKNELTKRLYDSIKNDSLEQNMNNKQSICNRKRLILFQIKQLHKNDLFCQNCHNNWSEYFKLNKKTLSKKDIMKQLTDIHMKLNICRKCQNLKEFQDINIENAIKYYGLNENDFIKCDIILRHGKGQMVTVTSTFYDKYTNEYICQQIAKMKYSKHFQRRTVDQQKNLADKARGLLQKGLNDKYIQIYAPNIDYNVDKTRFEYDEILYNATLLR